MVDGFNYLLNQYRLRNIFHGANDYDTERLQVLGSIGQHGRSSNIYSRTWACAGQSGSNSELDCLCDWLWIWGRHWFQD